MDELLQLMIENLPNFIGLIVAVYLLQRTLDRVLLDISDRIERIERRLDDLPRI